jgi:hypothetical protein
VLKSTAWDFAKISVVISLCGYGASEAIESAYRGPRIGAVCCDGWYSHATGRGAGSHHGGVSHWVHAEYDGPFKILRTPMLVLGHLGLASAVAFGSVSLCQTSNAGTPQTHKPLHDPTLGACPRCGGPLMMRHRRRDRKPFVGCSGYPSCRYARDLVDVPPSPCPDISAPGSRPTN